MAKLLTLIKGCFLTLVFVLVTFTPDFRFLPHYSWLLALLGLLALRDRKFKSLIEFKGKKNVGFLKLFLVVLFFNCLIIPLFHGLADFSYIPLQVGLVLTMCRCILLVYCLYKFNSGISLIDQYGKYFFLACCVYAAFTLYFIVDPGFKTFWLDNVLVEAEDRSVDFAVYEFRYSLNGFAAFSSASVFSFACLFCCYFIAFSKKVKLSQILCLMIMVVGCFFYGRVSLFGMLLGALLIFWMSGGFYKKTRIFCLIVLFVLALLAFLNIASKTNDSLLTWQEWAFSFIKQLFIDKEVTDYSATHMVEDMYYMPKTDTFLFGDGMYTNSNGSYYGHTDAGFMRLLLYGGIICLGLVYLFMTNLTFRIIRVSKSIVFKRFVLLTTILFFILELKGESYHHAIMMLYPLFLIQNFNNNISNRHVK